MSSPDRPLEGAGPWGSAWRTRQALIAVGAVAVVGSKLTLPGMGPSWPEAIAHTLLCLALAGALQVFPHLRPRAARIHGWLALYIGAWSVKVAYTNGFEPPHLTVLLMGLLIIGFIYPHARGVAGFHAAMLVALTVAMASRPAPHWVPSSLLGFYALMALVAWAVAVVRDRVLLQVRELSSVAEHVPQGVVVLDRAGRVVWSNHAVGRIGARAEPGTPIASLFSGPEGGLRVLDNALREARPVEQVQLCHPRDHGTGWVALTLQPVEAPDGRVERFVLLEDDVTAARAYMERLLADRAEALTALERTEDQLRQSQKMEALGQLAGGVAHDVNNVLTVILGHATLLQDSPADDPTRGASLDAIVTASERAADIAKRLLAFSRRRLITSRTVAIDPFVKGFARVVSSLVGEKVRIELDLGADDASVSTDAAQLDQVLLNLVVNARDAMPDGGTLRIATRTVDGPAEGGPHVRISVSDTGVGMDADTLAHLFEPFFTTKEPGKGTGLGLAIVDGLVRQLGGFVRVESAPGAGATFHVHLPFTRAAAEPEAARPGERLRGAGERVLLVEDDAAVRAVAGRILRRGGYAVVDVPDAEQAVVTAEHEPFDLLVTDLVLPQASGRDLAARLTAARPGLAVLFMSGYAPDDMADARFVAKPFTAEALLRCVHAALG